MRRGFEASNPDREIRFDPANRRDMVIYVEFAPDAAETANVAPIFRRQGMRRTNQWQ